jgi:hypothetical protein
VNAETITVSPVLMESALWGVLGAARRLLESAPDPQEVGFAAEELDLAVKLVDNLERLEAQGLVVTFDAAPIQLSSAVHAGYPTPARHRVDL